MTHAGTRVEVDVAAFELLSNPESPPLDLDDGNGNVATVGAPVWAPPAADMTMPCVESPSFEVRVFHDDGGARLVGAIELASPGNKDRDAERRAFAVKCASYLYQGVSLILLDIVTNRQANLHNEIIQVMENDARFQFDPEPELYAVAYRPVRRDTDEVALLWLASLALGQPLPTLPLFLGADLVLPVELEATYTEACRRLKLSGPER